MHCYHGWTKVPPHLMTRTQLRRERLALPPDATPVAECQDRHGNHPLYTRAAAAAIPYKRVPKDYSVLFAARYPARQDAYLDACAALFQLNRYAKHQRCSRRRRENIYALKDRWVARLWQEGFCVGAVLVRTPAALRPCGRCLGSGIDEEEICRRCEGEGSYLSGGVPYWGLRFEVADQRFFWHQPADQATWARPVGQEMPHEVIAREKPIRLPVGRLTEALALLTWVLRAEEHAAESDVSPPALRDYWLKDWGTGA